MGSSSRRDSWHIMAGLLETDNLSQFGWSLWTLTRRFPTLHRWARSGGHFCSWQQWWRSVHSEYMLYVQEHHRAGAPSLRWQLLELRNTVWRPSTPTSTTTFQPRIPVRDLPVWTGWGCCVECMWTIWTGCEEKMFSSRRTDSSTGCNNEPTQHLTI